MCQYLLFCFGVVCNGYFWLFCVQDLKHPDNSQNAVKCLNAMITNALSHAKDCLQYMEAIRAESNLRFCAIPQVCPEIKTC